MRSKSGQQGLTLIELMVGVLIGMITTVVVFQAFSLNERQKRATTGSADAQTNGALALFSLERDIRMAGFGLEADFMAKCTVTYSYFDNGGAAPGPLPGLDSVAPVVITDGGGAADQIVVVHYSDPADGDFSLPSYTTLRSTMPQPSSELNVSSTAGCKENDLAIVQQAGNCMLMQVTQIQKEALKVQHNPGGAGTAATPVYNPNNPYMTANGWPAFAKDAVVRCGLKPQQPIVQRTYRVNAGQLEVRDSGAANALPISPGVVVLQAQYGISDTEKENKVNNWVDATGIWAAGSLTRDNGRRIKAVRVAVAARSGEYEKPEAGASCATTTDAMLSKWSAWASFSGIKALPDWQCYRYKTFETVIPLRNVLWAAY
ncbi:MAG: PilW family protein [Azonexus sp.]|nr:PilW family protein [Azonexus sp.]MCK6413673.1 PilW family protein [Azonexus sp.]